MDTASQPDGTYEFGSRFVDCDTSFCKDCQADKSVCVACINNAAQKYYLQASPLKCLNKAEVAVLVGKGINLLTGDIENCFQNGICTKC